MPQSLEAALKEHSDWKVRLLLYVNGSRQYSEDQLGANAPCALGAWLKSVKIRYGNLPEYQRVIELHTRFHERAQEVIELAQSGQTFEAREALAEQGWFSFVCAELSREILYLKRRMAKAA